MDGKEVIKVRAQIGNMVWVGSDGQSSSLRLMDDGELLSTALYIKRRIEEAKELGLLFSPLYHKYSLDEWLKFFKAELEFRHQENFR